jgi:hypothetical protein
MHPGDGWSATDINTATFFDQTLRGQMPAWRARIYQIPGIDDAGLTYFYLPDGTASRQTWLLGLNSTYRVLSKTDWLARFY